MQRSILAEQADQAATLVHRQQQKQQTMNPSSPVSSATPNKPPSNSKSFTSAYPHPSSPQLTVQGYSYGSFIASLVPPLPEGAETAYILISPLMTPIANFTTFFTTSTSRGILSKHSAETHREGGRVASILAIYGTGDMFAFSTGRYRRFFDHVKHHWGERAKVVEIADGGHFWLDGRAMKCLLEEVEAFIQA